MYNIDKGYVSSYKGIPIEIVPIRKDDIILAHINEDTDLETCKALYEQLQKLFPDNKVSVINDYFINRISIFTDVSFNIDCGENEFLGRLPYDSDLY